MYGTKHTAAAAPVLAYTGMQSAWYVFAGVTLVFVGAALLGLVRRGNATRP